MLNCHLFKICGKEQILVFEESTQYVPYKRPLLRSGVRVCDLAKIDSELLE